MIWKPEAPHLPAEASSEEKNIKEVVLEIPKSLQAFVMFHPVGTPIMELFMRI